MNNKIIAAGVVVALCAVALIGVGYAYTATVQTTNNAFGSDYITIQTGNNAETVWSNAKINYDTVTTSDGVVFISEETVLTGEKTVMVKNVGVSNSAVITVDMIIPLSSFTNESYKALFYQAADEESSIAEKKSTAKLGDIEATVTVKDTNGDSTEDSLVWTFSSVPLNSALTVKIKCNSDISINVSGTNTSSIAGPSVTLPITFKASTPTPEPSPAW